MFYVLYLREGCLRVYKVFKNNEIIAVINSPTWVKQQENKTFLLCTEQEAQGIVINNDVFHVLGLPDIEGTESVALSKINEETYYAEQKNELNSAIRPASIAFVKLAESGNLDDITIVENSTQFATWVPKMSYVEGAIRLDEENGKLYRCIQAHTSQDDWRPHTTPALWKELSDPYLEFPDWSPPVGSHDSYTSGDKVSCDGKTWISEVDNNVWRPGVYGWREVTNEQ